MQQPQQYNGFTANITYVFGIVCAALWIVVDLAIKLYNWYRALLRVALEAHYKKHCSAAQESIFALEDSDITNNPYENMTPRTGVASAGSIWACVTTYANAAGTYQTSLGMQIWLWRGLTTDTRAERAVCNLILYRLSSLYIMQDCADKIEQINQLISFINAVATSYLIMWRIPYCDTLFGAMCRNVSTSLNQYRESVQQKIEQLEILHTLEMIQNLSPLLNRLLNKAKQDEKLSALTMLDLPNTLSHASQTALTFNTPAGTKTKQLKTIISLIDRIRPLIACMGKDTPLHKQLTRLCTCRAVIASAIPGHVTPNHSNATAHPLHHWQQHCGNNRSQRILAIESNSGWHKDNDGYNAEEKGCWTRQPQSRLQI